jgi:hypothetical protein
MPGSRDGTPKRSGPARPWDQDAEVTYGVRWTCVTCLGSGVEACGSCQGIGQCDCPDCDGDGCEGLCEACGGRGRCSTGFSVIPCVTCSGTGVGECFECEGDGIIDCGHCRGHGYARCQSCGGEGRARA